MNRLMPAGDCQHSGTYNGHPVVVAAAIAAVTAYRQPGFYEHIHSVSEQLLSGCRSLFARHNITARVQGLGARFGIYFGVPPEQEVADYTQAQRHDRATLMKFYAAAIEHGVYFHDYNGAPCHHGFSAAMTSSDVVEVLARLDRAIARLTAS
jgi:glutamate-1-semialdehyde 2,1-aminomutase